MPHGNAGANRTAFAGKRVMFQRYRVTAVVGGPNNGVPYDFRYWAPQLNGRSIWQSISNCGLAGAATTTSDAFRYSGSAFPCAGLRGAEHLGPRGRARRPREHVHALRRRDALPGLGQRARPARRADVSVSTDPSTGNVLIRETENLLRCSPDPATLPATAQTCSSFVPAGVRLDRQIIQQGDGRQALVTDTWSATDGKHHEVDVFYEHRLGGTSPVVSFPWAGGFTAYPPGFTQKPPATAPFSIFTRTSASAADGDAGNAQGAITLQDRPTTLRFRTSTALWTQYVRTVTPETPTRISFGFSWATAQADLATLIGQAERALGPTHCLVPNLVGKTLPTPSASCSPGTARSAPSSSRRRASRSKDRVIQQGRRARDDPDRRQRRRAARQLAPDREEVAGELPGGLSPGSYSVE